MKSGCQQKIGWVLGRWQWINTLVFSSYLFFLPFFSSFSFLFLLFFRLLYLCVLLLWFNVCRFKQVGVPAIAIEMTSMASGASKMELNPLQAAVQRDKEEVKKTQRSNSATGTYLALDEPHRKGVQKEMAPAIPLVTDGDGGKLPPPLNDPNNNNDPPSSSVRSSFESRFDHAAAAPPKERASLSRRKIQRKDRSSPVPSTSTTPHPKSHSLFSEAGEEGAAAVSVATTTAMGMGKFLYERPDDHCRVFELPWKLAGGSKALLYSFKD